MMFSFPYYAERKLLDVQKLQHAAGKAQLKGNYFVSVMLITKAVAIPLIIVSTTVGRDTVPSYWKESLTESYFIMHDVITFIC